MSIRPVRSENGTCSQGRRGDSELEWMDVDGISIPVPPPEHPRLYLRSRDIPDLHRRKSHPVLQATWEQWERLSQESVQYRVELDALRYLLGRDNGLAKRAITDALELIRGSSWPDKQDISRAIGRMMQTGAIVYDWCYGLLTPEDRDDFIEQFLRMANMMECGYPPFKQDFVVTHSAEMLIMMYMLSAGIAVYDEFPEMYRLCAGRFFKEAVPVRNWLYPGHAYHQGDSYGPFRYDSDLHPLWIFDRMGASNVYHPSQRFVPYLWIYMRRPDGARIRCGDSYKCFTPRGTPWPTLGTLLCASYYKDPYVYNEYLKGTDMPEGSTIAYFLWRDPDLQPRSETDLPLSRYFGPPFGWMIARTGWDEDSVIAQMKVNACNFFNHSHEDGGSFQIYYRGALAIDSGIYNGVDRELDPSDDFYCLRRASRSHRLNYLVRTIAHNSLLVYDPGEKFRRGVDEKLVNDGGQESRRANHRTSMNTLDLMLSDGINKTGEVLGHGFGPDPVKPDYTYLKADITEAYSPKVKEVKRSFVFLNLKNKDVPAALIVFDKVVSSNPEFRKFWLLHSIEEPQINGNDVVITRTEHGDRGKLINTTLLPEADNADIVPVGGPGREFWVFGRNFPFPPQAGADSHESGAWRVELSPRTPAESDCFLNVMQVMDREMGKKLDVKGIRAEGVIGVEIEDWMVVFSGSGERMDRPVVFSVSGEGVFKFLVADLVPGTWQVLRDGVVSVPAILVGSDDGVMFFEGREGRYSLLR